MAKIIPITKARKKPRTETVYMGDNLELLKSEIIPNESIDLIYIDPPFCTQRKQSSKKPFQPI